MSLEAELKCNTDAINRLADIMEKTHAQGPIENPAPVEVKKETKPKKTKVVKEKVAEPEVVKEKVAEPVEEPIKKGAAPEVASDKSEWYIHTMKLCNEYTAHTGDPQQTQKLAAECGIADLNDADDLALSQLATKLDTELGITR